MMKMKCAACGFIGNSSEYKSYHFLTGSDGYGEYIYSCPMCGTLRMDIQNEDFHFWHKRTEQPLSHRYIIVRDKKGHEYDGHFWEGTYCERLPGGGYCRSDKDFDEWRYE